MKLVPSSFAIILLSVINLWSCCYAETKVDVVANANTNTKTTTPEKLRSVLRKQRRQQRMLQDNNKNSGGDNNNSTATTEDGGDALSGDGVESVGDGVTDTGEPACFSSLSQVEVQGKGFMSIAKLQVGDYVRSSSSSSTSSSSSAGEFSRVFSLAHLDHRVNTEFIQISTIPTTTTNDDDVTQKQQNNNHHQHPSLEITNAHMIFVKEKGGFIRADQVSIGDTLLTDSSGSSSSNSVEVAVSDLKTIRRRGVYAPITESGTIVVSGIYASTYFEFFDLPTTMPQQQSLAHYFFAPHRLMCHYDFQLCRNEQHNEKGYSQNYAHTVIQILQLCDDFLPIIQLLLTLCAYPVLLLAYAFEQMIMMMSSSFVTTMLGGALLAKMMMSHKRTKEGSTISK